MEPGDLLTQIIPLVGSLSPLALALVAIVAFYQGWVIPAAVMEKIVAATVKEVVKVTNGQTERMALEVAERVTEATALLLDKHEQRIIREIDRYPTPSPGTGPLRGRHL